METTKNTRHAVGLDLKATSQTIALDAVGVMSGPEALCLPSSIAMAIMGHAERASLVALSLHELLIRDGREDLARLAWVNYLETATAMDLLEKSLGVVE